MLCHNRSPGDSGYRRARGYPAREEVTLVHYLKPNISARGNIYTGDSGFFSSVCAICVVM